MGCVIRGGSEYLLLSTGLEVMLEDVRGCELNGLGLLLLDGFLFHLRSYLSWLFCLFANAALCKPSPYSTFCHLMGRY